VREGDNKQMTQGALQTSNDSKLVTDIRRMIEETRAAVAITVNAGLTMLYWHIGERIDREILGHERAEYGKQIIATLSRQLLDEYGRGFSEKNLRRMMQFATVFPDERIVQTLCAKVGKVGARSPNTARIRQS